VGADVNTNGIVVGWASTSFDLHPFAWVDGTPVDLMADVSNAAFGLMRRINDAGVAVGEMAFYDAPYERAVKWSSATGRVTILPGLIGFAGAEGDTTAVGINERGTVVGQSYLPLNASGEAAIIPVSWRGRTVTELPIGRFAGGTAYDINDCGVIVGEGIMGAFDIRAVIWQRGRIRELDEMHDGPALGLTSAVAINNEGQILVNAGGPIAYILTPAP
jgi:probable HAF family extracellular repeat protein